MGEYTSKGQGNLNTVLGAIGTAGAVMPQLFRGGLFGVDGCGAVCSENVPVTRYDATLMQELSAQRSENALLKSQVYTDGKLVEIVKDYTAQIKDLAAEVRANKDAQCAINQEQAVFNGTVTATIGCVKGQVDQLLSLTKLVVPNSSICPGWGNVNITPATTPATA